MWVLAEIRIDISKLRSLPLSDELVRGASCIIAMTRSHMESIHYLFPEAAEKTFLLREFEDYAPSLDVADPIGLGREAYEVTRDIIRRALPGILKFIDSGALDGKVNTDTSTMNQPGNRNLEQVDPAIYQAVQRERKRQLENIELIASENYTSRAVMEAQGSVLTNKYAEGYPGRRYYGGCEFVDVVEQLAIDRAKELFGCAYANVQSHSGSQANQSVLLGLTKPGDTILGMSLDAGGHLTHGAAPNLSGKWFNAVQYGVRKDDGLLDYEELAALAAQHKPKLIIADCSASPGFIDFPRFRPIADSVGAYFMVAMAHFAGLVATGLYPSPLPHAHV